MDYNKFLDEVLTSLIHEDGSDLHLGVGRKPAIRINGQLVFLTNKENLKMEDMISVLNIILGKGGKLFKKFKGFKRFEVQYN